MLKKSIVLIMAVSIIGCASKQNDVVSKDLPFSGYKKEMSDYEAAKAAQKPTPSLWSEGSHGTVFLDYKARVVGDIVIVRIVENATANNSNNTSTAKKSSYDANVDAMLGLPLDGKMTDFMGGGQPFDPTISANTNNSWSGQGSKARSDSIQATIAARVVEILPSGNLVIEGQREIIVDQEKQTMTIRGVIRQKDIDASNTVASSAIADAQITYSGDGVISDANRKGWLATFIDWIWPF